MSENLTYWQKFININDVVIREEIILKRLLYIGYIDFLSLLDDLKEKTNLDNLIKIFIQLTKDEWISTYIKLYKLTNENEIKFNFISQLNPKVRNELFKNDKWRTKIPSQLKSNIDRLEYLEKTINDKNNEILYKYLEVYPNKEQIVEKIDNLLSCRPFLNIYNNADSIKDFIKNFKIDNFNKDFILTNFNNMKIQIEKEEKLKKSYDKISKIFDEIYYVNFKELEYLFQKNELTYVEGKSIIEANLKDFLIISYSREQNREIEDKGIKLFITQNKDIEILKNNEVIININKFLIENEKIIDELLLKLLFPEIKINIQKNISLLDEKDTLIIIKKDKFSTLLNSVLNNKKIMDSAKGFDEIKVFSRILGGYSKKVLQTNITQDSDLLGFASIDNLINVFKSLLEMIQVKEKMKVIETKINIARNYENSKFFLKIMSIFFGSYSKNLEKALENEKNNFTEIKSQISKRLSSGEFSTTDSVVRKIIGEIEKSNMSLYDFVAMKNSVENNPNQFIKYTEASMQRFLNDLLLREDGRKEFIKKMKLELDKIYEQRKNKKK